MNSDERTGPLAIILVFGLIALVALALAGTLALTDHPTEVVIVFVGICTTVAGYLAPSPLSKLPPATPSPEPTGNTNPAVVHWRPQPPSPGNPPIT